MKKVFWKVLCILICCCVFSACGKRGGGGELKNPEENQGDIPVSGGQEAERVNDYGSDNDGSEEKEEPIFPLLENYRERGIEIDPDIDGKGERYCGVLLNAENKIEYYTVSTLQKNGYFLFCYTLNDETLTWEREAVAWSKGFKVITHGMRTKTSASIWFARRETDSGKLSFPTGTRQKRGITNSDVWN